ncbi:MAG TPA: hypothetical protein VGB32_00775 [Candidatus Bathyarchaeia archaeon]
MPVDEVYSESLDTHPALQAALAAVILVTAYLGLNPPPGSRAPTPALILVLIITVALFFNFRSLEISVSGGRLTVGYGFIKSRVRLSDILYVEAVRPPFWRYGGLGVRLGLDGSVGYVVDYRRGVRVTRRRGMPIFFNTRNPERILQIIDEHETKLPTE